MKKTDEKNTLFRYITSEIDEFSFNSENYTKEGNQMDLKISFGVNAIEDKQIICSIDIVFRANEKQFLSVTTSSLFEIESESWQSLIDKDNKNITIKQDLCRVFTHTSMNVTRGILIAKLELTEAKEVQIPGIPVSKLDGGDVILNLDKSQITN